jgi:hypothetical protein
MLGMNTVLANRPIEPAPDEWPAEIGEQMAAAHRIYLNRPAARATRSGAARQAKN